jgi:hypothetical protein
MSNLFKNKEYEGIKINSITYNHNEFYIGSELETTVVKTVDMNFDYKKIKDANINVPISNYLTPDEVAEIILKELKSW